MARIDREELRLLVREALREALGKGGGKAHTPAPVPAPVAPASAPAAAGLGAAIRGGRRQVDVALRGADDLGRFAREIAEASADPSVRAAILEGKVRFVPTGAAAAAASTAPATPARETAGPFEMKTGVLSETRLIEIGRSHARIVLGAEVVLTPLARDKAREMKIELTRQKP